MEMENIILSLLLIKSMTIYEMKIFIEKFLSGTCSSSLGSMQVAIKKLMVNEKITFTEYEENGHKKKEYRITESGVEHFLNWMQTPLNWNKGKNMEEGKLFFLGMLPRDERIKMLKQVIEDTKQEQKQLKEIQIFIEITKDTLVETNVARMMQDEGLVKNVLRVSGEETLDLAVENIGSYQCYLLEYGLKKLETDLAFFQSVYEREVNGKVE